MKKILLFFILLSTLSSYSQRLVVVRDSMGHYVTIKPDTLSKDTMIGIYKDNKGGEYAMYITRNRKVYILRVSKRGTKYKQYIKISN